MALDWSQDTNFAKVLAVLATVAYPMLYLLNVKWFIRMVKGAIKLLTVKPEDKSE